MVVIRGERVVLRPFRPEEADRWHRARMASADDRTQFPVGPPDPDRLRERVERSGELHDGALDLAIEVDGRLIGEIGTYAEPGRTLWPGLFFLSIALFRPEDRGRGLAPRPSARCATGCSVPLAPNGSRARPRYRTRGCVASSRSLVSGSMA